MSVAESKALPDQFKRWIVASVSLLLLSLALVLGDIVAAFVYFSEKTSPLWVTLLGVAGAFGVALGFAGLFLLMAIAGWRSYQESKRVQIISPDHEGGGDR
jgi:predicted anti-sigma-YlaC factor YlaD